MKFKLVSKFKPIGDQARAIESLTKNFKKGVKNQVLLGVTGSGKTFTIASVIKRIQKPTLVISHNKTLAAQLYQEFKEFFPKNAVHYFVSYYDYYQPEAYLPQTNTYIQKDADINQEIDRLRHSAVQDLLTRKDIVIVASVSCIFNLGSPKMYQEVALEIKKEQRIKRQDFLKKLISLQYQRNEIDFKPGTFRARGNIVEIFNVTGKEIIRIEFSADKIEQILRCEVGNKDFDNFKFKISPRPELGTKANLKLNLYPAHFWVTPEEKLEIATANIKLELQERLRELKNQKKLLEAQRLSQRTNYDLEMLSQTGFCHGIENYSRHLEFRKPGQAPFTLLDYFSFGKNSEDPSCLVVIDESHQTIPQLRAMYAQDKARKQTLIEYGFRLPSALDNRPLDFKEFGKRAHQIIYDSATPQDYEKKKAGKKYIIKQLIRPTGLLEPSIEIRPIKDQVRSLVEEIKKRASQKQRTLVITLTKRLAEELADYLAEEGIKTHYLHSEIKTLERPQILKDLREGKYDVLVGINLLREGLDLPEVTLVAILDADKEGFLRSKTSLLQIMGRAARHPQGCAILYADKLTKSMKAAILEVKRRRKVQENYNRVHKIIPGPIVKPIRDWPFTKTKVREEFLMLKDIKLLEVEMKEAAKNLDFERAAEIRDLIKEERTNFNKMSKVA